MPRTRAKSASSRRARSTRLPALGAHEAVFAAVSDPTRRAILDRLRSHAEGHDVATIAAAFPISRPAISKHLRILKQSGLVHERKVGRQRIYRLDPQPLRVLDDWLAAYRLHWAAALHDLKMFAESAHARTGAKP